MPDFQEEQEKEADVAKLKEQLSKMEEEATALAVYQEQLVKQLHRPGNLHIQFGEEN
jgi:uncharacterized membrane protein (DUF106 family)